MDRNSKGKAENMNRKRPILLISDYNVRAEHLKAVRKGLEAVIALTEVAIPIYQLEDSETQALLPSEYRETHGDYRWFVKNATNTREGARVGYINAVVALTLFEVSVWSKALNPYYILVTGDGIYANEYVGVVGWYRELLGAVISTAPFVGLSEPLRSDCIETLAIHNIGHTFGLVPEHRDKGVIEQYGLHCTNYCSMRHYGDWFGITSDRKKLGPFCPQCLADLKALFK